MVQQHQATQTTGHVLPPKRRQTNPWTTDDVILGLSIWWVRMTRPDAQDFSSEVAVTFDGLQRDLQYGGPAAPAL